MCVVDCGKWCRYVEWNADFVDFCSKKVEFELDEGLRLEGKPGMAAGSMFRDNNEHDDDDDDDDG